jgi:hypothetical protein
VERPARRRLLIKPSRLRAHASRIEIGKYIQLRVQPFDLPDMRFGQLDRRNLTGAQKLQLLRR